MIVVKIGGSLYNTPELKHWLTALADYSIQFPIVIVPGGGPFADQVRAAQKTHHFNDATAHHMAILAMKQYGLLLSALEPQCQPSRTSEISSSAFSVWLPDDELLTEPSLTKNWDISSDSIALWLARKLGAKQLLLIKHASNQIQSITELSSNSIIDSGFAALFSNSPINTKIVNYQNYSKLPQILSCQNEPSLFLP
ncbi:MAG: delta 1-pyrroline-5-carboxylate synthetase [Methylococcaceae bacterium]|nr:delta 1-pyrroline-5-carboxylate synthetase [Methylococcaceae bacterium]